MKVSFFARGNKLQVRVPQKGIYVRLSSGIVIPSNLKFTTTRQVVSGTSQEAQEINAEITRHRKFISSVLNNGLDLKKEYDAFLEPIEVIIDNTDYEIVSLCRQYIQRCINGEIKARSGRKVTTSTLTNYRFIVNSLHQYAHTAPRLELLSYNLSHITDIQTKTKISDRWQSWFNGFIIYMTNKGFKVNTKSLVMNVLNTMVNYYQKKFFILLPSIPKVKSYEIPIVVLPDGFVTTFINSPIYEKLEGEMKFVFEACATMLFSSLRVSDAVTLKWDNFTDNKKNLFMNKWNLKTGALSTAPFPKRLENIYRENANKYKDIYTPISNKDRKSVIYHNIKELFKMFPELHEVVSSSVIDPEGNMHSDTKPLYEWVTPHMLRKTAITNMDALGMAEATIKQMTGHKENSRAYSRYKAYNNRRHNEDMERYLEVLNKPI